MTKNPVVNALVAFGYIVIIVLVMSWGTRLGAGKPDTFMAPMAVVSLFTLSAAVMGYVFCYQPIQLYFENKKKEAADLFLRTVAVFGLLTMLILGMMFSEIGK